VSCLRRRPAASASHQGTTEQGAARRQGDRLQQPLPDQPAGRVKAAGEVTDGQPVVGQDRPRDRR
jgi:hypothetical protein